MHSTALFLLTSFFLTASAICPSVHRVSSFNPQRFMKTWYLVAHNNPLLFLTSCNSVQISGNDTIESVHLRQKLFLRGTNMDFEMNDHANGEIRVKVGGQNIFDKRPRVIVVDTDYNNWAVLHICQYVLFYPYSQVWILKSYPEKFRFQWDDNIINALAKVNVEPSQLMTINHFLCLPERLTLQNVFTFNQ